MSIAKTAINGIWNHIASKCQGEVATPSDKSSFTVTEVRQDKIVISFESDNSLSVDREYVEGALRYLLANGHHAGNPCEIRSNKNYDDAGPLCRAARKTGPSQMNITYVLPILKEMGLVGTSPRTSDSVSTAWYTA